VRRLTLTKHHGLGNDFLVLLDADPADIERGAELARRLCDRRTGIGADGLLFGSGTAAHPVMVLFNADGSRAEMSGNGIRCFAHALTMRSAVPATLAIHTDAGLREVAVRAGSRADTLVAAVDMGPVEALDEPAGWAQLGCDPMRPVRHLSLGNPHSVVGVEDVGEVDLAHLGAMVAHVNLEIVQPGPEPHAITMRVHERGAGITMACGTGACASAWAAREWGLVPASAGEIVVHMDGGDATVRVHHPAPGRVTLSGPATFVGTVTIDTVTVDADS
jgi:diaminopimelate epimerase